MTPETKATLDDYENILKGLNDTIENVAISEIPCELHSFYMNAKGKRVTEKIVSSNLTKLILNGVHAELRGIEAYVTRRKEQGQVAPETADEILDRVKEIRKNI